MNSKIKSAAKAQGFYDMPIYRVGDEKPDYYDLFVWLPWLGTPYMFGGSLREEAFDTIDKKIGYLQGVFEGCPANFISFANSNGKVERCKRWINEVARHMCEGKTVSSDNENGRLLGLVGGGVISHHIRYCFPICHVVEIHPEVVEFIKNYKPLI